MEFGFEYIQEILPMLVKGAGVSLQLFLVTLVFSIPLGLPIALGERSSILPIRWICKFYVFIFRGTPLMLQLFFFYFFFPIYLDIRMEAFSTAALTFVLNYAAYFAEIYRGGISGIEVGQYEAAYSLGFSKFQTMTRIVLPQTMRMVLPPISNETIVLVKDTALASVISLAEMMKMSESIVNRDGSLIAYVLAALIYLLFTFVLTVILGRIEKRCSRYDTVAA